MISDHHQPSPGTQYAERLFEHHLQRIHLAVHLDADRLEQLGQKLTVRPARGYRRNRFDQVADRSERPLAAHPLDASCDPVRSVQFAVIPENPDQFSRFVTVHYVRGRKPGTLIHPHVERSVETERESALPRIEMVRRHAQIGQHPVHLFVSVQAQLPPHETEIRFYEREAGVVGDVAAGVAILVEPQQAPLCGKPLQNPARMPAAAESQVYVNPA